MKRLNPAPALLLLVMALPLAACSGLLKSEQPAKQVYLLMPLASDQPARKEQNLHELAISLSVVPGLDTDRIQALAPDARLLHYANARWPDFLPEVLTSVLRRSLRDSGRFTAVTASERVAEGGWSLRLEVQRFYGLRGSDGATHSAVAAMQGRLRCNGSEYPLDLSASAPIGEERLSPIVAAHQSALDQVTADLLRRVDTLCGA